MYENILILFFIYEILRIFRIVLSDLVTIKKYRNLLMWPDRKTEYGNKN